jgi:hypothetical protein
LEQTTQKRASKAAITIEQNDRLLSREEKDISDTHSFCRPRRLHFRQRDAFGCKDFGYSVVSLKVNAL